MLLRMVWALGTARNRVLIIRAMMMSREYQLCHASAPTTPIPRDRSTGKNQTGGGTDQEIMDTEKGCGNGLQNQQLFTGFGLVGKGSECQGHQTENLSDDEFHSFLHSAVGAVFRYRYTAMTVYHRIPVQVNPFSGISG